jgi:hypothetical protein
LREEPIAISGSGTLVLMIRKTFCRLKRLISEDLNQKSDPIQASPAMRDIRTLWLIPGWR